MATPRVTITRALPRAGGWIGAIAFAFVAMRYKETDNYRTE